MLFYLFAPSVVRIPRVKTKDKISLEWLSFDVCLEDEEAVKGVHIQKLNELISKLLI